MAGKEARRQPKLGNYHTEVKPLVSSLIISKDFVAEPALAPPTVQIDQEVMAQYEQELKEGQHMPLPDEDDADL